MSKGLLAQSVVSVDYVIIFNETHLRRVLSCYFRYYHRSRTHLSLNKDCPDPRRIQLPSAGTIVAFPKVGGRITATNVARPEPQRESGGRFGGIRPFPLIAQGRAHIRVSGQDQAFDYDDPGDWVPRTDKISEHGRLSRAAPCDRVGY
jgi:hypothetical protein